MSGSTGVTRGRVIGAVVVLLLVAAAYSAWLIWRTERDLRAAETAVDQLEAAVRNDQPAARADAIEELRSTAAAAASRTDGVWWSAMTVVPVVGDDLRGVRALSASLDLLARGAIEPLLDTADTLDELNTADGFDLGRLEAMTPAVVGAQDALSRARELVVSEDSTGFAGALRPRFDEYAGRVSELDDMLTSAELALGLLPGLLGADGPRDYLFIFQNNAEIRATGGIAGSWARIRADNGTLTLREQGNAGDLNTGRQVANLTDEELAVYSQLPATFFQDPNFIPDFQRAAELYKAFWSSKYPKTPLDGVVSLDPIGMSYLMAGTGPITADGVTLSADNIVREVLSNTYTTLPEPRRQDQRFQSVASSIFQAVTGEIPKPIEFVEGFARAVDERRFLLAPFDATAVRALKGSTVLGELPADGPHPHVNVALNDATGSKMSFYLRYRGSLTSLECGDGIQLLEGEVILSQTITQQEAQRLPAYVTGGDYGTRTGEQFVTLRIYGPVGGAIREVDLNGQALNPDYGLAIGGRPVVTVGLLLTNTEEQRLTWQVSTSPDGDQVKDGTLQMTPGIVSGTYTDVVRSSC